VRISGLAASGGSNLPAISVRDQRRDANLNLLHVAGVHEVLSDDLEPPLEWENAKGGRALQADLEQVHVGGRESTVGVDVREAPLDGGEDSQDVGLGLEDGSELEALLLDARVDPRLAHLLRRVVKGAGVALPAEHRLAEAGVRGAVGKASAVVRVLASVEVADVPVEELARLVGALVVTRAVVDADLGEERLLEALDLVGDDVGDEEGLLDISDHRRHGVADLVVPGVVVRGRQEAVDEELEEDLLVRSRWKGLPEGDELLHGVVEEGGADHGKVRLNYEVVGV